MADVYFLKTKEYKGVPAVIEKLGFYNALPQNAFVAVKLHFGEKGNKGFIKPRFVSPVVEGLKAKKFAPFLTDTNTIYRGERSDAVHHMATAHGHGFRMEGCGAPVVIADGLRGNSYREVPVDGRHFKNVKIGLAIAEADGIVMMSHVKGHIVAGFGGAIKNAGMGCGARSGKYEMHASMKPKMEVKFCISCGRCVKMCPADALALHGKKIKMDEARCIGCGECIHVCPKKVFDIPWGTSPAVVTERFVEYAKGAISGKPVVYVNFLNHITAECDCFPTQSKPVIDDIGILVSTDPVAIDQASVDMINKAHGSDLFRELHPSIDPEIQLWYAEELGLGTKKYRLV